MAICEILGFKVDVGPIKKGPRFGDEFEYPTFQRRLRGKPDLEGRLHGYTASITNNEVVKVFRVDGLSITLVSTLCGDEINHDPITKHNLHHFK